ncbi:unnamed protein product, partial [Rotaria sordida]
MSSSTWNPASLSSFIFDRNRYRRSASEQTHTVTTHEYHSYRRRESPCPYQSHCEYCPCINCRLYRQPSYRHHMSRRQTSSFTPDGRKEFYSSAHSIRDEMRKGSPTGIGIALNSFRQFSPQTEYQQRQQQRRRQQQQQQQQQQQHQQAYQPHHFHDYNEYERQRQERLLQINRRSTREVQPGDQAVPSATSTSRYDEAVIKRRYVFADVLESERSYVADLQRIIEIYLYELTRQECPWFVKEKKDLLFSNIEDIFAFHKVLFLNDLTNAIEHEPKELASVFLRRRDQFLNLYSQYMYDRSRSEHVLQTNPNIQRYFDELTQRLGLSSDLTLNNLLNRPIQRLEKYKNILQEMVKYTNRMREDSTIFQQAYTMISNVINDARQRDATELIDNIPFTNEQLGDLKRHDVVLIKTADHDLDSVNEIGTRLRERFLYLYRHKIVLCRRKRADSRLESRSLAFKQAYNTNEITFIQENFPDDDKKFEITFNDNERVTFHARNAFSKMSLVRALRDNLKSLGFVEEIEMVETTETEDDTRQKRSTVKKRTMDVLESTILEQQKRGRSSGQTTSGTSDFYSVGSETESSYQTAGETEDFKPKFLKKLNDTLATEGDFVTLECIVVSTTPVHATWFKNNIPLQDNADCRLIQEDKRFQIHIKEAFVEDGGVYSIKISNHAGTVICSCKLFVREETSDERTIRDDLVIREGSSPEAKKDTTDNEEELRITEMTYDQTGAYKLTPHIGRAPIFLQSLMPIISKAGDIVTLKCTVTATPMPSAIWYKNGQEIQAGGRYSVFQDQNGTYSLVISDALPQDSGSYEITVRNQYGTANSKTNLQILERESVFIPIPATRVSTEEHGTAKLSCAVKRPDVYVDWYKGEQALFSEKQEENHKYKRVDDGLQRELIVKNVSTDDQGDYVCQADKYRVTLHLNVQGPAAEFVRPLENIEVTENNEAVFECQLSKEDAQVEWWFRGIPIVTSQHHLIASRGYIRQLIIPKVAMNDEGEYSIRVDNKNTSTAQLFVKEQPIIFRRPLRSQIIEESSLTVSNNAVFECELNKPLKQMLWFKSNVQHLAPSDKYQIESFANGLIHRLTIRNVNLRDDGEYTASTGLNTSQARLTIESLLPVFIVPLMDARANTRETVKLSCETSNSCQVIWTHRGKKIIENSYKYTIGNFNNSTLHTLDIDDLDLRDQGEVLCSIAQHPSVATTCKLLVEDAQQQSAFFTPLKPFMEVGRGQDAILECETYESTYFQWFKDGTTLTQTSNKYRTVGDEKHSTLIVKQFTEYDEGVYTCVTREGKSTSTTIRTVIHRERTPRSEERFGSYMKIDSPRASQTPELGGYRSSVSPTAPRYIPSLGDDDRRRSPRFEETRRTKKITIHETSEQRVSSGPRPGTTKFRPSASPSPQREYIRSGYSSGTSPERERISMPRHFSPSTTYKSSSQLQEFSHYIDRSSQSPSPSPTRKTSITLTNVTPSAKMPPVYEEQDEHQRHRTSVTFSPSRSPARQPSTRTSAERKVVEMQIPMSPTMPRHELKHAPYREESIPEERIQFLDSETYDKQTPIFHREEPYGLSTSRVQITETLAMVQITQPLVDTRVEQGKPLRLVVETSQPSSEATWFKTDIYSTAPNQAKKLDENGKYHMITQGTRHILIVPNATSDDNGEYICRIQNAMTRAQVQVTNEDLQFIRRLPPSIDVIGGRDIIIECEMNKMDTQAIWKKDNELIRAPQKFIPVSENKKHKLIIKDASIEDSGLYTVIVNDLESTTYVNVTPEPLLILKPLQDQRVHSGDTVTFTCVCSKAPKTVQWYLNGYPLPINERYQTKLIDREIQLTINNVQESDIGTITCCLNNTITTANLTLDDKDKTLKFIKLLEDDDTGHIQVDSPFMLECRTNRPTYQIRWFKDNREISQYDQVMRTISDGCTHVLQISRAQPDHTGRYRCVVTDSLETSCHITVREPEYRFTQSLPSNIQFSPQTDRSLTLDGTLNRKPTQIQWFKNSIEIFPSRKHEIVNEHHVVALIIHDLSPDDQGLYRCVIANGQAVNECQVSMNLMTESDRRLIKPLQDQNIYVHDTCTLHVQFQGDAPDVKWYKNGQEIYPNQKYRLVRHGNEQTLIIDDCQLTQDQAYYSLRLATNPKVDLTSCYVQVKDKYVTITKHLEPQRCILGQKQQVQFDCETTPTDKKPVWLFNNQPIDNSSKYELVSTDNTHHLLFIHQPELSDQGQYTISFPESNQSSTANLQVLQTPSTLEFIQPLDEVFLCEEGDNFVLVTRTNKPTQVSWMKNGYKLSTKTKLDSLPTNEHRLTIDKAQKIDHEGIYTCIIDANNIATQCHVKILERELQLIQPLPKQIRLNEHDTLTLICETNRKPKKVQWFKDQSNIPLETNNSLMIINADETCTLIINNANKFDSGTYTCRLEDRLITVSDVKIHESAVQFVDGPQSYLVWRRREDGPVVNISCTLNKPNVPVKWFRENQEIRPELNNKYEVISEGTIQCLLIHDAQKEDSTKYVISLGTTYRACHLDVVDDTGLSTDDESFDRVVQPLFPLQRQEVMEGDSLTIEVSPDSDLRLTSPNQFRLLKNNQPVVDDSHIQLERDTSSIDSNRWVIRLVDVDLKDSGVYSIEINNQIRQDLLDLSVKKRPIQRQFITLPKDEFYLHETITLECKFERPIKTKNLLPTWFKNGRPIQPSNHYLINVESSIKDGPTKYSITIKNVDFSDEGIYELRSDYLIVETPFVRIIERPTQPAPLRTVTEGDSLQIDVNIDQKDYQQISPDDLLNQITVLKDNRPIINKPEINKWFDGKEFNLELKNLSLNDRGLYEIDIQGQRTSICLLDVKERQPDVFLLDLDRNTFEEGETIRLACTFPQRPGPIANWFKDGHLIHPNENIQLIDENNTLTIVIRNAKRTDSGVYEVRIGPVIARAPMIYVIPKREQPDIPVQNVREGDTVTLSVEGLQTNVRPQDIQLLKNGKPIVPSQKPKTSIKREDDKLRIILQTLGLDDSALYSVQIQNDIHPLAQIVVEPRQPEIQQMQLEQDTFYIGDTVTLDLEFTNEPTEQPRWTKDNILLRNNERVSIETIGNRVTLIVRDLRLDDAGVYEVQSGPLIVRTPFINVVERPHDVTEIVDETITYTITPNRPLPPVETKVCTIKEGDDVTLKISSPTPITINDVHLYKNGQPIPIDNETRKHIRLEQFGNKDVRLTITNARLIDAGDYSAVINDNMQSIIKLDVQPRELQIQMINLPQDTFKENETLKIDCRFPQSNINTDYKWYKDNQPIIPNDRIVMKKDTNSDSLTILNLQISDAGVYELRNPNNILRTPPIKVISTEKKINIEELRPQVSSKLVHEGDTVTFELTPNFDVPLNKIELFHEESPITHEPHVHMKKDYKTNSITVQIEDIKIPDHGLYTAIVQGQSVPLAELIVEPRPTIIQNMDLPKEVFYTGERLELECEFPQVPKGDQPKWFKNNQLLQPTPNIHLLTENNGRKHSLIIDHLKPEDTGQYELRVKGLIVRTPLIRVIQREQPQIDQQPSPYIVTEVEDDQDKYKLKPEQPQRRISQVVIEDITSQQNIPSSPISRENIQRVQEGDSIQLKVVSTLDVKPNQIRLIHDGVPIDTKKRSSIIVHRVSPGNYTVSLLNLRVSDSGKYEYQVEGAPTPKHLVKLYVEPRPIKEKTLHVPQTTFNVGESILFKVDFDEKDQITEIPKWYKNEMFIPIDTSPRHKLTIDRITRTHTFEIYNLQVEDSGVYEMRTPNLTVKTPSLPSIEQPTVEQTIITDEVTTTETIPIVKETPTTIEEVIQKDVSPVIEEIQKPTEKRPIIEEVIEENPKPATTVTEEVTTIEEIIQETKVPVEEQPEQPIQPTSTTEEVIEEALKVPTTIVEEKSETKPTEQITTIVKEETITEKEKPITDERIEEKPTVQEIVTTEEVTITETIPTIKETPTTTEEVATTKEFIEEKPKTPTTNIEETIITEEVIQEEKVPVKEQPKYPTETASTTEEVIEETSEVPITVVEEKSETKPTEQITTVVEEETIKEKEKPITDERIEEKPRVEKIISDIPTKTVEEQLISPEKPAIEETITTEEVTITETIPTIKETPTTTEELISPEKPAIEETITTEEVTITETIPTIKETPTTTEEVIQKDISPIIEKTEKPTEKIPIVEEVTTTEKVIEEKPKPTTTVVEEVTTTEEVIQAMKVPIEEQPKYSTETIPTTEKVIEEAPKVPIAIVEEKPKTKSTEQIKTIVEEEAIKEKPLIDQPTEEKSTIEKIVFDVPATTVVETITKEEVTTTETIPTVKESLTTTEDIEEGPIVEEAITIEEFVKEKPKTQTATIEETITTEEVIQEKKIPVEEQPKYSIETISTTEEVIEEAPKVPTTVVEEKPEMKPIEEVTTTFQEETAVEEEKPTQTQPIEEVTKAEESIPKAQTTTIEEEIKTIEEPFVSIEKPVVEQPVTKEEEIPITETISTVTETVIITETPSKETVPDQEQSKLTTEVIEEYKTPITEQPTITAITEETTTITEQVIPEDTVPSVVETPKTIEKIPTAEEKPTELISTVEEVTQEKPSVDEQIKPIIEIVSTIEDIIPTEKIEEQPVPKEETPKAPTTVTEELVEKKIELKPIEEITTITEEKLTSEQEKPTITQQVEKTSEVEVPTTTVSEQITTTKEELTTLEKPTVEDVVQKDIVPSAEEVVKIPEVPAPVAEDVAAEKSAMKPDIIQTVEESKTEQILSETSIKPSEVPHETKETITTTEQVYEEKKVHFQEQPKETIETIEDKTITATEQPKSTTSIIEDETTTQTLAPEETVSEQEQVITPLVQDTIVEQQPIVTETVTTEEIFPTSVQVKQEETISTVVDTTKPTETVIEEKPIAPTPIIEEVPTTEKIIQETKASVEEQPRYPTETISTTEEVPKVPTSEVEEKQETKPTESIPTVIEEETEKPLIYQPSEEKPTVDKLVSDIVTTTIAEGIKTVEEQNLILTEKPTVEEIITKEEITTTETIPTDKETSITTEETIQKDVSPVIDETQKPTEKVIEEKPKPTTAVIEEVTTTEETIQETKVPVEEQPKKPIETTSTIEEVIEKASTVPTAITEEKPETKPTEQKTTVVEEEKEKPLIDERTEEKPTVEGIISDIPTTTIEETVITKEVIQEEKVPVEEQPKHPTDQTLLVEERIEKKPLEEVIKTVQDEDIIEQQKPTITKTTEETFVTEMIVPVVPTMVPEEEIKTVEEQLTSIEKPTVEQTITTEEVTTTETIPTVKEIQEDMSPRIDETPKPTEKIPISEEEAKIKETIKEQQAATMTIEEVIEKQPEFKPTKEETTTYQQETIITEDKPVADQSIENIIVETPTVTTEEKTITVEKELVSNQKPSFEQIVTEEEKSIVTTEPTQPAELPVQRIEENTNLTITVETPISKNLVLLKDGVPLPVSEHVIITPISPTTTTIEILKAKPEDEGEYTIIVNEQEQPLVKLEVTPKPVTRQEMQIPKTQFNEKETLTIVCQFDATPEEPFVFLHNDQRIVPDSRVTTTVEDNKYTIVVKDLRPEEDEGVYTLKSDHLILDTPSITVLPKEKKPHTETTKVEEEQVIVTTVPEEKKKPKLQEEQIPKTQLPVHEVEETTTVTLTVEQPQTTKPEEVVLLKDGEELKPSDHVKITPTSPTTTEIQITKVKPEDEGDYTVKVKDVEQPLVRLK